jgi:hypothetical protein
MCGSTANGVCGDTDIFGTRAVFLNRTLQLLFRLVKILDLFILSMNMCGSESKSLRRICGAV